MTARHKQSIQFLIALALLSSAGCASGTQAIATPTAPPPQTRASAAPTPAPGALGDKQSASYTVRLFSTPTPPVRGTSALEVIISDAQGKPIDNAAVSFDIDMTNMSHGKYVVAAAPQGNGRYAGQVRFMMPGPWRAITSIERPGQPAEQVRFDFNVNMR